LVDSADTVQQAWQSGDSEALLDRTRWLKGSAGTLGFDVFTEPAEELQSCLAAGERDRVQQILEQLYVLVRRVQKGMDAADERSEPIVTRANGG
jgi:HPt (histidine-containing phosphotransfer) domain-containing protein